MTGDDNLPTAEDDFVRGYHDIPDTAELNALSFAQLASSLSSCQKDSPKFHVIEREMKKRIAQDQAKINRPNMLWAAGVGGTFALVGVVLGAYLNNSPVAKQITPTATMQQVEKSDLGVKPPIANIPVSQPPAVAPAPQPEPVQKNAQQRKANP